MAEDGIVGPYAGSQAREVTISVAEWERMHNENAVTEPETPAPKPDCPAAKITRRKANVVQPQPEPESDEEEPEVGFEDEENWEVAPDRTRRSRSTADDVAEADAEAWDDESEDEDIADDEEKDEEDEDEDEEEDRYDRAQTIERASPDGNRTYSYSCATVWNGTNNPYDEIIHRSKPCRSVSCVGGACGTEVRHGLPPWRTGLD